MIISDSVHKNSVLVRFGLTRFPGFNRLLLLNISADFSQFGKEFMEDLALFEGDKFYYGN